jgi:hypothetical protein
VRWTCRVLGYEFDRLESEKAMSAAYWRQHSLQCIAAALATLPPDADEKAKRKAISAAYPFGQRKHYSYLIWRQEVQKYFGTYKRSDKDRARAKRYREEGTKGEIEMAKTIGKLVFGKPWRDQVV